MERKLTQAERSQLKASHKKSRDTRERDRIKAVLAFDEGYSYSEIARILLLDDETIRRHIDDYFSKNKIIPESGGSQSYLNAEETKSLLSHLEGTIYLHAKDICAYVQKTFNKTYSGRGMTKWLHQHHFCYKKPHGVPAKADAQKQEEFIEKYTELKRSLKPDEIIYFADGVHPDYQTQLVSGWIKQGERKAIKKTSKQTRVNLIGAINLATNEVEYKQVDWVDSKNLILFVEQLLSKNPLVQKIHLILDNAGYHKSKEFVDYIKTRRVELHYLPAYSPNLNPIERLWKIMREHVTYNKYYEKFALFRQEILNFFANIEDYADEIRTRINDNFQRLKFV